jgi:hypothetical protein
MTAEVAASNMAQGGQSHLHGFLSDARVTTCRDILYLAHNTLPGTHLAHPAHANAPVTMTTLPVRSGMSLGPHVDFGGND